MAAGQIFEDIISSEPYRKKPFASVLSDAAVRRSLEHFGVS